MHNDSTKFVSRKELHALLEQISDLLEDSLAQMDERLEKKGRKIKAEVLAAFLKETSKLAAVSVASGAPRVSVRAVAVAGSRC